LGGDFWQTLPVIQNSTKQQTLHACIFKSYLWPRCILLQLKENMRLDSTGLSDSHRQELRSFAEWLLKVDNGDAPSIQIENNPSNKYIEIPQSLLLPHQQRDLDGLLSFVYCLGGEPENPASYFFERAIVSPTNDVAASINSKMIQRLTS
jgi:ATP-dependent DNA helicase PIF1